MRIMQKTAPTTILEVKAQEESVRCYPFDSVCALLNKNGKIFAFH